MIQDVVFTLQIQSIYNTIYYHLELRIVVFTLQIKSIHNYIIILHEFATIIISTFK